MDEHENCPICMEIPEKEIYQCAGGHTICNTCVAKLDSCPQCREPYGTTKIRNRVLEQILDKQTFPCIYGDRGCKEKLKRENISNHAEICSNKPVYLCKLLGFPNCNFVLNPSDCIKTMKHFEEQHAAVSERKRGHCKVWIWHADIKSTIDAPSNKKWNPILLNVDAEWCKGSLFMIFGSMDVSRKSISWNCLQICGSSENENYEAEFTLFNGEAKKPVVKWTLPVLNAQTNVSDDLLKNCAVEIPLSFIKTLCVETTNIPITVVIQSSNLTEKKHSSKKPTELWTFSSDCKTASQNATSGQATHMTVTSTAVLATTEQGPLFQRAFPHTRTENAAAASMQRLNIDQVNISSLFTSPDIGVGVIYPGVNCDGCSARSFAGKQYKCLQCPDYDLCENCMATGTHSSHVFIIVTTFEQRELIQRSFERIQLPGNPQEDQNPFLVRINWHMTTCDGCRAYPIVGKQYKCLQCPKHDLCGSCFSLGTHSSHMFIMMAYYNQRALIMKYFAQIR